MATKKPSQKAVVVDSRKEREPPTLVPSSVPEPVRPPGALLLAEEVAKADGSAERARQAAAVAALSPRSSLLTAADLAAAEAPEPSAAGGRPLRVVSTEKEAQADVEAEPARPAVEASEPEPVTLPPAIEQRSAAPTQAVASSTARPVRKQSSGLLDAVAALWNALLRFLGLSGNKRRLR